MHQTIWMNGRVLPMSEARISPEDRGYQFADGVYEVIRLYGGRPFALEQHLQRLARSAEAISLDLPYTLDQLAAAINDHLAAGAPEDGMVYLQATRGHAERNHLYPKRQQPLVLFYTRALAPVPQVGATRGLRVITVEDDRWKRCYIKCIALLPNVLAKNIVAEAGADEAVFIDAGRVTEGTHSNVLLVKAGRLITAPVGPKVLGGITREALLEIAAQLHMEVQQRYPAVQELHDADEVMITNTTREIGWVSQVDGRPISSAIGPVTRRLHEELRRVVTTEVSPACVG